MAKFKKGAKKSGSDSAQAQAEQLSRKLGESAQQVWLAGVGAFGRAQLEGGKMFEALVKEGMKVEQGARRFAGGRAGVVRDAVENKVGQARERATDTWDRLEKVFEERVQRALVKLGVPGREDLADLSQRVEALTAELRRQGGAKPRKPTAARKGAARKKAPAAKKAASRKQTTKGTARTPRKVAKAAKTPRARKATTTPSSAG
jgi:poly(hydroxyalkanoate) granule-associated protein